MPPIAATLEAPAPPQLAAADPVAEAARAGLTATPKSLPPWLFYDEAGSRLFEQITTLPEYYLTRTERALFAAHADDIFSELGCSTSHRDVGSTNVTIAELGAGTAAKTGILLRALARRQPRVLYQPIDISPTALDEACTQIERTIPGVTVRPRVANYVTEAFRIERPHDTRILALYIGSSIGNFSPAEARNILTRLRSQLAPGDALLLGTDLAPCLSGAGLSETSLSATDPNKSVVTLLAAYNDAAGVTAAFNRNLLVRLNRELDADFGLQRFAHRALWNPIHSRIEMHLESLGAQTVFIPASPCGPSLTLRFAPGETIHTENSYKFTPAALTTLLASAAFAPIRTFADPQNLFAVTLATAI